ncbi:MAG: GNAT family N-acetyltransferase [Pseudomonadota bacterium]
MRLVEPNPERLDTLFGWFDNDAAVRRWGGPVMRIPMSRTSMEEDAQIGVLASYFLVDDQEVLGFGQYYDRLNRCHLGRLVICPNRRGERLGQQLIERLVHDGHQRLGLSEQSLFVLDDNHRAIALYQRLGFTFAHYPGNDGMGDEVRYMVRRARSISS